MTDPKKVIEEVIGRGIEWFDYQAKDKAFWNAYFSEANQIVNSEVFNNEIHKFVEDLMKFMAYEAKDFDQILHTRTAIVTLETFKQRLKSVENPNKLETNELPYEAI